MVSSSNYTEIDCKDNYEERRITRGPIAVAIFFVCDKACYFSSSPSLPTLKRADRKDLMEANLSSNHQSLRHERNPLKFDITSQLQAFLRASNAPFTLLRVCYDVVLLHLSYPFTLLRFCTKTEGKHPFLSVHIDLPDYK